MKVYCAWHQKYFGTDRFLREVEGPADEISHSICATCYLLTAPSVPPEDQKEQANPSCGVLALSERHGLIH